MKLIQSHLNKIKASLGEAQKTVETAIQIGLILQEKPK